LKWDGPDFCVEIFAFFHIPRMFGGIAIQCRPVCGKWLGDLHPVSIPFPF
jgi:hypothetical protein